MSVETKIKIGVPIFGYHHFAHCERQILRNGFFTANLGDNMQSIAIRQLLKRCGVSEDNMISINRDTLTSYDGEPVALIMNGVFPQTCFPTPPQVTPIFIGLCVREPTILRFRSYFESHQPIGCRDIETKNLFERHGISAYVTGCLTMTIAKRRADDANERRQKVFIVYGAGSGAFPAAVLKHIPKAHLDDSEFIFHRIPVSDFPLSEKRSLEVEAYALSLLKRYAAHAKLVITPLHHVAAPCMALGVPVIICREEMDSRFSYIREFIKIHTPETFEQIDWYPSPVNIDAIRDGMEQMVIKAIAPYGYVKPKPRNSML